MIGAPAGIILGINFGVLLVVALIVAEKVREEAKVPVFRLGDTGAMPALTLADQNKWHVFLSQ